MTDASVFTLSLEELPEAGFSRKLAVAPLGNPLTLKVTPAVKPPERKIFASKWVLSPGETVCESGLAVKLKSLGAGAVTTSVTDVMRVRVPLTPVMVNG